MAKAYIPADIGPRWWRDIPGYGGRYRANRAGDIQRVFPDGRVRDMTPYRKRGRTPRDRLFVKLTADGKAKDVAVLKVMVETWYGSRGRSLVPYHKNGIVSDNRADNIGFASKRELGKMTGHMSGRRKSVFKVAEGGEEVEVYRSAREAARQNHMSYQAVLDRCHGKVKKPFASDGFTYQFEK